MAKYLVLANQTLGNPTLVAQLEGLARQDPSARFVLVVPATPIRHLLGRARTADGAHAAAAKRADRARNLLTSHGLTVVETRIGPESPVDAVAEVLQTDPDFAGVVVSTLPGEISRWQKAHVPQTIESQFQLPVHHVTAPAAWTIGP